MASAAPPPASDDALVATARDYFESFLLNYTTDSDTVEPSSGADEPALPYVEQVRKNKPKREREKRSARTQKHLTSSPSPCLSQPRARARAA